MHEYSIDQETKLPGKLSKVTPEEPEDGIESPKQRRRPDIHTEQLHLPTDSGILNPSGQKLAGKGSQRNDVIQLTEGQKRIGMIASISIESGEDLSARLEQRVADIQNSARKIKEGSETDYNTLNSGGNSMNLPHIKSANKRKNNTMDEDDQDRAYLNLTDLRDQQV